MDTLHERLAAVAEHAPTGGAPAAELWDRGRRAHRRRVAAVAAVVLLVGAAGAGVGVLVAHGGADRSAPPPAAPVHVTLPIRYPAGVPLTDLGATPGPLAAIWLAPRAGGGAPVVVGLVAATGTIGTLPIVLPEDDPQAPHGTMSLALSTDGRRIAYPSASRELEVVVHDVVSGETVSPDIVTRPGYAWVDATHLVGNDTRGGDTDGWVWEPGRGVQLVDPHPYTDWPGGRKVTVSSEGFQTCELTLADRIGPVDVPPLCDALGFIRSDFVLGHENDPSAGDRTVVALDIRRLRTAQLDDPGLRRVVVSAEAPERVAFATDLIGRALDAAGGAR